MMGFGDLLSRLAESVQSDRGPTVVLLDDEERRVAEAILNEEASLSDRDLPELQAGDLPMDEQQAIQVHIDPARIGRVIGKGAETIRALGEEFAAEVNIDDDGTVTIRAANSQKADAL